MAQCADRLLWVPLHLGGHGHCTMGLGGPLERRAGKTANVADLILHGRGEC